MSAEAWGARGADGGNSVKGAWATVGVGVCNGGRVFWLHTAPYGLNDVQGWGLRA